MVDKLAEYDHSSLTIEKGAPDGCPPLIDPTRDALLLDVDGTIIDKGQKPIPGVQAILIPDRQRDRRDVYRFATTDQNGHFTLRVIAPGDYKVFAWEDLEPGAYNDPDFLRKYEALATPVKVSDSATLSVAVKVLPAN